MRGGKPRGVSRRERLELIWAALVPGVLALVGALAGTGGRLCWLAPLAALPGGLWLCRCWERLGAADLAQGLEQAFGRRLGQVLTAGYFLWGLLLLAVSARQYTERLAASFQEMPRWITLAAALGLCLWLSRGTGEAFARGGRILFLFLMVTLGAILFLALPGVDWRYLWPPERADWGGVLPGGLLCLGLTGYGVYALCLPLQEGGRTQSGWWAVWGCGGVAAILLVTVGAFGPTLTAALEEPFLSLLEGVKVPGAFRRGEAALAAVLVFGELVLFGLLTQGCKSLWAALVPAGRGSGLFVAAAFLLSEGRWMPRLGAPFLLWGNLAAGILIPTLAFFTKKGKKDRKEAATFCGEEEALRADVGAEEKIEKSCEENEKKC